MWTEGGGGIGRERDGAVQIKVNLIPGDACVVVHPLMKDPSIAPPGPLVHRLSRYGLTEKETAQYATHCEMALPDITSIVHPGPVFFLATDDQNARAKERLLEAGMPLPRSERAHWAAGLQLHGETGMQ